MDNLLKKLTMLWLMTFVGVMALPVIVVLVPLDAGAVNPALAVYFLYAAGALFLATLVMAKFMAASRKVPAVVEKGDEMRRVQRYMALVGVADAPVMMGLVYYLLSRDINGLMICVALSVIGFLVIRPVADNRV